MEQFEAKIARHGLRNLFRVLNQKEEDRDPNLADDDPLLAAFPYVNGGLFDGDDIEIPPFTEEIMDLLLRNASDDFDWSGISPTIFGAVFESTLNPETRRSGGMHYTSIENIHKVIDPLFLDDLTLEFESILYDNPETPEEKRKKEEQWKRLQADEAKAHAQHNYTELKRVQAEISKIGPILKTFVEGVRGRCKKRLFFININFFSLS